MENKHVLSSKTMLGLMLAYLGMHAAPVLANMGFADPQGMATWLEQAGLLLAGYGRFVAEKPLK